MALPINIEDLLHKRKVESNRIEFKKGWNPISIYHSICAFANDIDNLGGGYIIIGIEEENGVAKRPAIGIPIEKLDGIQKDMQRFNNLIEPYYMPRTSIEEIDGVSIFVIWCYAGTNRPYAVPSDVTAKLKKATYYVRNNSCSIEAKGEVLDELRDLANKTPFDERGNENIQLSDISFALVRDHLATVGSSLLDTLNFSAFSETLEQMELYTGSTEKRVLKNVAAMMFCENLDKIFPETYVRIAQFYEGREVAPDNFKEYPIIKGSVPQMIKKTMEFFEVNIIQEQIIKQEFDARSIRYFNYPYQALEEAVVNAFYHRDYSVREPIEIVIEPQRISILSFAGPDRSISDESIKEAKSLRSRRYKNKLLGSFLKALDLSEGWATGIPTIQQKLQENGSPRATIETDENRTYFLIDIPCHPQFLATHKTTHKTTLKTTHKILSLMKENPSITIEELCEKCGLTRDGLNWNIRKLKKEGLIIRVGGKKQGHWEVKE